MNQVQKRGKFITIEGGEGVGKSSNIAFIQSWVKKNLSRELVLTREPGGTPLAEEIRELFIVPRDELVDENTELLLVFAARAQHIARVIKPNLEQGCWVLSDRFTDATFAYQGGGRGLDTKVILQLERIVQKDLQPDLTILLDLPVEEGLNRASERGDFDRIEREKISFFEDVRNAYLRRAQEDPDRFVIIDASQALDKVQLDISNALEVFCNESGEMQ